MEPLPRAMSETKRGCEVSPGFGKRVGSRGTPECGVPGGRRMSPGLPNLQKGLYMRRKIVLIRFLYPGPGWGCLPGV